MSNKHSRTNNMDTVYSKEEKPGLHVLLSEKQILSLKERFLREPNRCLEKRTFRQALYDIASIIYDDKEYELLFYKINFLRSNTHVAWEEFLTHIILELQFQESDKLSNQLDPPIKYTPKEIKSKHRMSINRITFVPELKADRIVNHLYGVYVTCSKDGLINYWSIDMEKIRSVQTKNIGRQIQATWIMDLVVMPDVNVICTSTTDRDIRFYDTAAKKFELRIVITSMDYIVCALYYTFYLDPHKESKLIFGDTNGKVSLLKINVVERGPFMSNPREPRLTVTYDTLVKGNVPHMTIIEVPTVHTDWVQQVAYYETIHCVISISTCSKQSMFIYNTKGKDSSYSFKVQKGFSCFTIATTMHLVATGGPDYLVRIWNPFMPTRAISILRGHHSKIVSIVLQDDNRMLCSIDKERCIRVWDVQEQMCLQNFPALTSALGEKDSLATYYNPVSRQLFVAGRVIVYFQIYPLLNGEYTDGVSHSKEISAVLYVKLFRLVITCGYDSFIIIWDPWTGRRIKVFRNAHTISIHGETTPIPITAAAIDPSDQYLITGASNGTLKAIVEGTWQLKKIAKYAQSFGSNSGIQDRAFVHYYRLMIMGENRGVTEFADSDDIGSSQCKRWMRRHLEDVLCSAMHPQALATASESGELVFWHLETGQPYGMFNVHNPTERIQQHTVKQKAPPPIILDKKKPHNSQKSCINIPKVQEPMEYKKNSINAMLFLKTRPMEANIGSLIVSLETGNIQMWSHHSGGGYISEFSAIHSEKDFVITLCTDRDNNYLLTGHMSGYIKTWHMINYGVPKEQHVHICKPLLRLKFPFLWKDLLLGRAKRAHRIDVPILLNSFKAHLMAVTGIVYLDANESFVSCSSDRSCRIWTLNGRYMGTLGTFKPWAYIKPNVRPHPDRKYPPPADIERSGSFTTLKQGPFMQALLYNNNNKVSSVVILIGSVFGNTRLKSVILNHKDESDQDKYRTYYNSTNARNQVLAGGDVPRSLTKKQRLTQYEILTVPGQDTFYGQRVDPDSILGKHFIMPERGVKHVVINLDTSINIPIYSEMNLQEPVDIERPPTPELVKKNRLQPNIQKKTV